MNYTVDLKPRAIKDLKHLQKQDASRIADALERLQSDLTGDVKKLTNFTPEYRLRVGQFRVLFEIENETQIISLSRCSSARGIPVEGEIKMVTLHPSILERDGKKAFAVLPYEEFLKIEEELDDLEDIKDLRTAKAEEVTASTVSLASVRNELKI